MKLRVTPKKGGRLLITLLLLIFMGIFTSWECTHIAPVDQALGGEKDPSKLEVTQSYQIAKVATNQFVVSTTQCVKEKKEKYSGDFTIAKIIALVINIMVMLVVISLLVSPKKSKSVCEFMENIGNNINRH